MVAQHHTGHRQPVGHGRFEGVAFHAAGDRTKYRQPRFRVVARVTEHERWAASRLLTACPGIKLL